MQPTQNTLVQEIILGVVAGIIAITAPVLLYLGTINFSGALAVWAIAAGVVGFKLALNAPSPTQQQQIGTLQAQQNAQNGNLQGLVQYVLSVLPSIVQSVSQPAPVAPPQAQQTAQAEQVQPSVLTPVVPPEANPVTMSNPTGTVTLATLAPAPPNASEVEVYRLAGTTPPPQFKSFTIPDVSAPYPAVGQGIPLK